jgi:hypothetical protein
MTDQEFRELVEFLVETPEIVEQLTSSLTEHDTKWKPSNNEFSALEQLCHLRDIEREGYAVRIRRLLTEDLPLLGDIDGGRLASERDYNSQDLNAALSEFTLARSENISTLRTLASEQLERSGVLEGVGEITLGGVLSLMRGHDLSHREELARLRERCLGPAVAEGPSLNGD